MSLFNCRKFDSVKEIRCSKQHESLIDHRLLVAEINNPESCLHNCDMKHYHYAGSEPRGHVQVEKQRSKYQILRNSGFQSLALFLYLIFFRLKFLITELRKSLDENLNIFKTNKKEKLAVFMPKVSLQRMFFVWVSHIIQIPSNLKVLCYSNALNVVSDMPSDMLCCSFMVKNKETAHFGKANWPLHLSCAAAILFNLRWHCWQSSSIGKEIPCPHGILSWLWPTNLRQTAF